uniref:Uncharacterized protein n=1 Tax=Kalanchoe fedtschenkoi TaxID=63787 RepID=A0A7N0V1N9_KALFE
MQNRFKQVANMSLAEIPARYIKNFKESSYHQHVLPTPIAEGSHQHVLGLGIKFISARRRI